MNEINDQVKWEMLSYEEKNHQLFLKQKALLKKYGIGEGLENTLGGLFLYRDGRLRRTGIIEGERCGRERPYQPADWQERHTEDVSFSERNQT